ncbi:MAG: hypothetical protein ABFR75_08430 [Acidobacteriota bacterium]
MEKRSKFNKFSALLIFIILALIVVSITLNIGSALKNPSENVVHKSK